MTKIAAPLACVLGAAIALAACETTTAPGPGPAGPVAFSAAAFDWSQAPGRGRVEGRFGYASRGVAYTCSGVVLTPETPWVRQRMQTLYRSTERAVLPASDVRSRMPSDSPNYSAYVRPTNCDSEGRFVFTGVPDGAWYVITAGRPSSGAEDLAFMRRIVVRNGQTVRVEF